MGLLTWLGFGDIPEARSETPPEQPPQGSGVMPPARSDVATLTDSTAIGLVEVYRAVQIISTAVKQLTLDSWRGDEPVSPKPSAIRKPDASSTLPIFLEQTANSLAITGNAYWRIERDDRGVRNLTVLNAYDCFPNEDGTLGWAGRTKPLQPSEFRHLALMRRPGFHKGLGPIQAARATLQGALDLQNYASEWFHSGDVPSGVLTSDQHLSPDQAKNYKDAWEQRDAHSVAVLGAGLAYSPVLLSPEDAQFIASQQFTTTAIARLFGIPAHLMLAAVEGSSMTYSNVAQADLTFVRWTLMTYLREIEDAFTEVTPAGQTVRFNVDAILRPDTVTRYTAHTMGKGFMTLNEIRAIEGLPPLPGGDTLPTATTEVPNV